MLTPNRKIIFKKETELLWFSCSLLSTFLCLVLLKKKKFKKREKTQTNYSTIFSHCNQPTAVQLINFCSPLAINLRLRSNLHECKTLRKFPFFRNKPLITNKTLRQGQAKIKGAYFTAFLLLLHLASQILNIYLPLTKDGGTRTGCIFTVM